MYMLHSVSEERCGPQECKLYDILKEKGRLHEFGAALLRVWLCVCLSILNWGGGVNKYAGRKLLIGLCRM